MMRSPRVLRATVEVFEPLTLGVEEPRLWPLIACWHFNHDGGDLKLIFYCWIGAERGRNRGFKP
jgi:hypothetical protein